MAGVKQRAGAGPKVSTRLRIAAFLMAVSFTLLCAQLWRLQIILGEAYARDAEDNRIHPVRLKGPRGMIYGADPTTVLAENRGAWDLVIIPSECADLEAALSLLETLVGISPEEARRRIEEDRKKYGPYKQTVIKEDITRDELRRVDEFAHGLSGVLTVVSPKRRYPYGRTGGQLLGYIRPMSPEEYATRRQPSESGREPYKLDELIGVSGLEQYYEDTLRGYDGQMLVNVYAAGEPQLLRDDHGKPYIEFDSLGHRIQEERQFRLPPRMGESIYTTLDIELQAECENLLKGLEGAIAILNAETGAVLALASSTSYDPNVFVMSGRKAERAAILSDTKNRPLRNRCYREVYPPGSVFKPIMAIAALEEGVIDERTTFVCGGRFALPGTKAWACWKTGGHGRMNVVDALSQSCNVFFFNVGRKLGAEKIKKWCAKLSLGELTGIDLPGEAAGLIPSPEWKMAQHPGDPTEGRWYPGETINLSIGQGKAALTPLQTTVMMAAVMNGGRRVRPFLNQAQGPSVTEPLISERTLRLVRQGLLECVEDDRPPSGTGFRAKMPGYTILGKTGTAQVASMETYRGLKEEAIPYEKRAHAWFICGVVDRDPPIAITILVEHGLHGSTGASVLAPHIIEFFYARHRDAAPPLTVASLEEQE